MTWTRQDDAALHRYCRELAADLADAHADDDSPALSAWRWVAIVAMGIALSAVALLLKHDCGRGF